MKELEDRAHAHRVLLSSDAMRHFIAVCRQVVDRVAFLDRVVADARASYPSEDGWVVLNLSRMQEICARHQMPIDPNIITVAEEKQAPEIAKTPLGAGSLAEAIIAGNVNAAYQMIEHRPIIALADAAADLDAAYRQKQGLGTVSDQVSELLKESVKEVSVTQLQAVILALTSAIDGTYTDEESAVKMAILKAVNVIHG